PLIPLNQNPVPDPVAISQEIEREHQDFIGNSTFFSTEEVPGSENSPVLNDLMLDLLKSLNINVLDASKDEKEIKEAFNELYQDLILQPGGQDRIFAFTKLATQQGQFLGQVVLNQHYNTVNLYEEAGHLLVYYLEALSKINPAIGQELGIDYLWKKPSDPNATDYLAQTEEYKVHYQKTFEQMMARLSHQKNTIEEYARILSTDPNYFGDNTTLVNSLIQ